MTARVDSSQAQPQFQPQHVEVEYGPFFTAAFDSSDPQGAIQARIQQLVPDVKRALSLKGFLNNFFDNVFFSRDSAKNDIEFLLQNIDKVGVENCVLILGNACQIAAAQENEELTNLLNYHIIDVVKDYNLRGNKFQDQSIDLSNLDTSFLLPQRPGILGSGITYGTVASCLIGAVATYYLFHGIYSTYAYLTAPKSIQDILLDKYQKDPEGLKETLAKRFENGCQDLKAHSQDKLECHFAKAISGTDLSIENIREEYGIDRVQMEKISSIYSVASSLNIANRAIEKADSNWATPEQMRIGARICSARDGDSNKQHALDLLLKAAEKDGAVGDLGTFYMENGWFDDAVAVFQKGKRNEALRIRNALAYISSKSGDPGHKKAYDAFVKKMSEETVDMIEKDTGMHAWSVVNYIAGTATAAGRTAMSAFILFCIYKGVSAYLNYKPPTGATS